MAFGHPWYNYHMTRTFDWVSKHDERSRNYPMRAIIGQPAKTAKLWREGPVLDQGSEGACVGFGWTAELLAQPFVPASVPTVPVAQNFALEVYNSAKRIDEWAGENYDGTSVLAGAKVIQQKGFIGGYRWCFGIEDVRDSVIAHGPVVIGIPWFSGMYETGKWGIVNVTGDMVGGHCITITGYHPRKWTPSGRVEAFRWRNSWGTSYGRNGSGWIRYDDLALLLKDQGEACVPLDRRTPVL
jgi:Papain family cysteine protease